MAATCATELADFEASMSFDAPLSTSVLPRWQRKQLQQQQQQQQQQQLQQQQQDAADTSACSAAPSSSTSTAGLAQQAAGGGGSGERRDRFIPNRSSMCMSRSNYLMSKENYGGENTAPGAAASGGAGSTDGGEFQKVLESNLLGSSSSSSSAAGAGHRVLAFKNKAPAPQEGYQNGLRVLYSQNKGASSSRSSAAAFRSTRHIPSAPVRILDAPDLLDDYYLNLLSWGSNDVLAVALGQCVYLWSAKSGDITELCSLEGEQDYVSSVSWTASGTHLAVGTAGGETQFWDSSALTMLRSMDGHSARVGALAWNEHVLTSGSRDTTAVHHDLRTQRHAVGTLRGHTQEVRERAYLCVCVCVYL